MSRLRTARGSNGLVRENHRHLTNVGEANLSPCAVNGGFKFSSREADMRMEAACREGTCPSCGNDLDAPVLEAMAKRYSL